MKTNPIITLSNSGFKIANKVWSIPNTYSLTIQSNASGTATSDALIGTENYQTNLYATPIQGAKLSGWNVTGGSVVDNKFIFGTSDATIEPVFEEQTFIQYSGFTYGVSGSYGQTIDPAPGIPKNLTATYIQVEGGEWSGVYTRNPVGLSDCLGLYAPSAGVYSLIWNNWSSYSYNGLGTQSDGTTASITAIYSLDFWNKTNWNIDTFRNKNITELPQVAENIHNGEYLTNCSNMFNGNTKISGEVIPFITAMKAACPNLTTTNGCLNGCTGASDYAQAIAQYPEWF